MKQLLPTALLALGAIACSGSSEDRSKPDKEKSKKDRGVVHIADIRSEAPKDWQEQPAKSRMRAYTFRLPGTGGAGDAELIVFRGIGGTARKNIDRWKEQYTPAEGKKRADVIKEKEIKVGGYPALYLDAEGTYTPPKFSVSGPKEPQKDYRMLGVCIDIPDKPSQILLRGPAKTVAKYKQQFDDWLKAFK